MDEFKKLTPEQKKKLVKKLLAKKRAYGESMLTAVERGMQYEQGMG